MLTERDTRKYFKSLSENGEVQLIDVATDMGLILPDVLLHHISECKSCEQQIKLYVTYIIYKSACQLKLVDPELIWCPYATAAHDAPVQGAAGFLKNEIYIWDDKEYIFVLEATFNENNIITYVEKERKTH
jgi:hypothetical protein